MGKKKLVNQKNPNIIKFQQFFIKFININNIPHIMQINQQNSIPNYYQLDELPFLRVDILNQESGLSAKRMLQIRNLSYKYENIVSKIFTYWPKIQQKQQQPVLKIVVLSQLPVTNIENLAYMASELNKNQQISQHQWNNIINNIETFKNQSNKIVDSYLMIQYSMKMVNYKNVWQNVYYSVQQDCFKMKISFKNLGFDISPMVKKNKIVQNFQEGFVIKNQALVGMLKQKLNEKLLNLNKKGYQKDTIKKTMAKIQKFYQREVKKMDQNLLQLKLKYNFPILRQKRYVPLNFNDGLDGKRLTQSIVSNKNKNCMYAHFTGYNSSNYKELENSYCQYCGIQIKQIQQNKLLIYLRDNIFNPLNKSILYCPEFNRFKLISVISQEQMAKKKRQMIELSKDKDAIQEQNVSNTAMEEDNMMSEMKNQGDSSHSNQNKGQSSIQFLNYMHLCSTLKNMYPTTKSRIKFASKKPIQYVSYIFTLELQNNTKTEQIKRRQIDKYFLSFELTDPCRGRYCNHLEFADLRLYYKNRIKKITFMHEQQVYICPICKQEIKDIDLMYLKQTLVLLKYIKKILQPQRQQYMQQKQKKIINKNSIKIKINNVESKLFIEYLVEDKKTNGFRKCQDYIDKFYSTLVDPYIPFSEYGLGLQKKNKRLQSIYNFQNEDQGQMEALFEKLEDKWFGIEDSSLII